MSRARLAWPGHRLLLAILFAVGLLLSGKADARTGNPSGWVVQQASEEIVVGRLTLRYEPSLSEEAHRLSKLAPLWWSEMERDMAGDLDDALLINFVTYSGGVATATGMPRWAAGVANPARGEIMIARYAPDGSTTNLSSLLKHEMAHVALHRAVGGAAVPRGFHEGVAEAFSDDVSFARAQTLATAVFGGGVPGAEGLNRAFRDDDPLDVSVAYAAARDLATYLRFHDANGSDFRQLLGGLRLGHNFEYSVVRAYGLGLDELVNTWREGLPGRFVWYALLTGGGMPLALVMPLVGAAWWRRRRVLRRAWARLDREEALARQRIAAASFLQPV
jgi:hypothetical protein